MQSPVLFLWRFHSMTHSTRPCCSWSSEVPNADLCWDHSRHWSSSCLWCVSYPYLISSFPLFLWPWVFVLLFISLGPMSPLCLFRRVLSHTCLLILPYIPSLPSFLWQSHNPNLFPTLAIIARPHRSLCRCSCHIKYISSGWLLGCPLCILRWVAENCFGNGGRVRGRDSVGRQSLTSWYLCIFESVVLRTGSWEMVAGGSFNTHCGGF